MTKPNVVIVTTLSTTPVERIGDREPELLIIFEGRVNGSARMVGVAMLVEAHMARGLADLLLADPHVAAATYSDADRAMADIEVVDGRVQIIAAERPKLIEPPVPDIKEKPHGDQA